jgi:hypothetical protein
MYRSFAHQYQAIALVFSKFGDGHVFDSERFEACSHLWVEQASRGHSGPVRGPELVMQFKWQPDTLALWDNRSTRRYAPNDYAGCRREICQVVVEGDRPF